MEKKLQPPNPHITPPNKLVEGSSSWNCVPNECQLPNGAVHEIDELEIKEIRRQLRKESKEKKSYGVNVPLADGEAQYGYNFDLSTTPRKKQAPKEVKKQIEKEVEKKTEPIKKDKEISLQKEQKDIFVLENALNFFQSNPFQGNPNPKPNPNPNPKNIEKEEASVLRGFFRGLQESGSGFLDTLPNFSPHENGAPDHLSDRQSALRRITSLLETARKGSMRRDVERSITENYSNSPSTSSTTVPICHDDCELPVEEMLYRSKNIFELTPYVLKYYTDPGYFPHDTSSGSASSKKKNPQFSMSLHTEESNFGFGVTPHLDVDGNTYLIIIKIHSGGALDLYNRKQPVHKAITILSKIHAVNGLNTLEDMQRELLYPHVKKSSQKNNESGPQAVRIIIQQPGIYMEKISILFEQALYVLNGGNRKTKRDKEWNQNEDGVKLKGKEDGNHSDATVLTDEDAPNIPPMGNIRSVSFSEQIGKPGRQCQPCTTFNSRPFSLFSECADRKHQY